MRLHAPIRVLFLSAWAPPVSRPQAILLGRLLRGLASHGIELLLLSETGSDVPGVLQQGTYTRRRGLAHSVIWRALRLHPVAYTRAAYRSVFVNARSLLLDAGRRPDRIVSFANPYHVNVLGGLLSRRHGIPLVAHYSDPYVDNPYRSSSESAARLARVEAWVLNVAARVVFCNHRLAKRVVAAHRLSDPRRFAVIPHACHAIPGAGFLSASASNGQVTMRHLGAFYGPRSPAPLLDGLVDLRERAPQLYRRIRVELIGSDMYGRREDVGRAVAKRGLDAVVHCLGPVSHEASLELMRTASVLLSIDGDLVDSPFLPSKLVEYLGASKPIVCLTTLDSASADLCAEVRIPAVDLRDRHAVRGALETALTRPATFRPDPGACRNYGLDAVVERWLAVLAADP